MDFLNEVGDCWRVLSRGRLDPLSIFQRVHSILGENTNGNGGSRNVNSETIKKKQKKLLLWAMRGKLIWIRIFINGGGKEK